MSWYDVYDSVYDNAEVQRMTRKQAAATTAVVTVVLVAGLAALALAFDGPLPVWLGVSVALAAWTGLGLWIVHRRQRLRRVVWCVKLSNQEVVGYDYARRRITIPWTKVERVDLGERSLTIVGPQPVSLEITHHFPEFSQLSHRVMHHADRHRIAVFVDGRPWQQIDVYDVFPFLAEDTSSPRRGSEAL